MVLSVTGKDSTRIKQILRSGTVVFHFYRYWWSGFDIDEAELTEILARYVIETDDGAFVSVENPGIRRAAPEVMRRLLAGEPVDPALVYFRTTPRFETASPRHAWLTESVFLCSGVRRDGTIAYVLKS